MGSNVKKNENEELIKIVNEDWPVLQDLSKNKKSFTIKKKTKVTDIQDSIANIQQDVLLDESENDELAQDLKKIETFQKEKMAVVDEHANISLQTQSEQKSTTATTNNNTLDVKNIQGNEFFKLLLIGLTHLYINKTTILLKPVRFVVSNYKMVLSALIHFLVPLVMTYFITTKVDFISMQLAKESFFMNCIYDIVFYLGATFVWISGQVLFSGLFTMLFKSMQEIAHIGKEKK